MALKSLIQRLLDSRTTAAEAANASIPLYSKTSQYVQGTKTEEDFSAVAPFDCFVTANVNSAQTSTSGLCSCGIKVNGANINRSNTYFPTGSVWFDRGAFVKKGDLVTVSFNPWSETMIGTQFTIFFHKLIGGGYNSIVWRTLSCLRALSNFSQRSFCKVKSLGFLNSVLRLSAMAQTFLAQAPRTSLAMLHRATAGRLLGAIQAQSQLLKFKSIMGKWHLLPSSTETPLGVVSAVTSKKEPLLNSYAEAETHRIIPFGSTKQVQTLNLLSTGGALC